MRLATIDLGSNTVRLLVAEVVRRGSWTPVHEEQRVTRLGEGLAAGGELGGAPMARTAATVREYVERARTLGASRIRIVGTSAIRDARNGRWFAATLERDTGAPVDVVSGEDEARLAVRGVLDGLGRPRGTLIVFDIGGGSTEYIRIRDGAIVAATSLRLGVVPLAEQFPFPRPAEAGRYRAMADDVGRRLRRELPASIQATDVDELVGTAGTVTTLAALDLGLETYDRGRVQGHRLSRDALARQGARLSALTVEERAALPCLEPGRADLVLPGLAIVEETLDLLGVASLVVSDAGLREGMMAEAAEKYA
ncbi:MAG: Ppx/GppA family phosphatase [Candidatus Rokubacteria bacterium]|nr:Ppx/GppA family phosphatase [Candidatus Rokubacteria bacterium]